MVVPNKILMVSSVKREWGGATGMPLRDDRVSSWMPHDNMMSRMVLLGRWELFDWYVRNIESLFVLEKDTSTTSRPPYQILRTIIISPLQDSITDAGRTYISCFDQNVSYH
jgi:hypothetical protein